MLDHEDEEEIQNNLDTNPEYKNNKMEDFLRYMIINSSLCLSADVGRNAVGMKQRGWGPTAYTIQTVIELTKRKTESFDIYMDKNSL